MRVALWLQVEHLPREAEEPPLGKAFQIGLHGMITAVFDLSRYSNRLPAPPKSLAPVETFARPEASFTVRCRPIPKQQAG